jgi:alanyl-tRNA synthetase
MWDRPWPEAIGGKTGAATWMPPPPLGKRGFCEPGGRATRLSVVALAPWNERTRSNEPAKRYPVILRRFEEYGFPLHHDNRIVPDDDTTLFICSGMQCVRHRFTSPDGSVYGSLQNCVRTNDLGLVGDGTHLTSFGMLGNFSFGGPDYRVSCEMWTSILQDLKIELEPVHVHPAREDHKRIWRGLGHEVVDDPECVWSDGQIGGHCCEVYSRGVEIGNLVNPLGHSTDVGFGVERLVMLLEGKGRVDETSLFDQRLDSVTRDHIRTLCLFHRKGIEPGGKGRSYVCRRLLRRVLDSAFGPQPWLEWVEVERGLQSQSLQRGRKMWKRHKDKPPQWWWETCGLTEEDLQFLG